jgi:hypothetical protein
MNKQQLLGLLRHVATTTGGVLMTSNDERYVAAGVLLALLGTGDSYRAKRVRPLKVPSIAPLLVCALLGLFAMGLTGCATSGGAPDRTEVAAAITQPVVKNLVVPLLNKNPELEPALQAVAAGIDVVFNQGTLTPEQLRSFIDALAVKHPQMDERDKLVIGSAIWDAYTIYTEMTGKTVVEITDPAASALLDAFRKGIVDGIAFYHAFKR